MHGALCQSPGTPYGFVCSVDKVYLFLYGPPVKTRGHPSNQSSVRKEGLLGHPYPFVLSPPNSTFGCLLTQSPINAQLKEFREPHFLETFTRYTLSFLI